MKKILVVMALLSTIFAYGNDIIITKSSEKIDAVIQEVSSTEIKYKKANNLKGPVFVINISELSSIIYGNGEVQVFNNQPQKPANNYNNSYAMGMSSSNNYNTPYNQAKSNMPGMITRLGNNQYVLDNQYMNNQQLENFLQRNCQQAYKQFRVGKYYQTYGIVGVVAGPLLCLPLGLSLYATAYDWSQYYCGIFFMSFGAAMTVSSVPLLAIGTIRKNNAHEVFNATCARQYSQHKMSLDLQVKTNGLGLALNF